MEERRFSAALRLSFSCFARGSEAEGACTSFNVLSSRAEHEGREASFGQSREPALSEPEHIEGNRTGICFRRLSEQPQTGDSCGLPPFAKLRRCLGLSPLASPERSRQHSERARDGAPLDRVIPVKIKSCEGWATRQVLPRQASD